MNTETRVNFKDVKINTLIQRKSYINNHILIYKVVEIDEKEYNIGFNEFSKFIKLQLIDVINGDFNFYLEMKEINKYMHFYSYENKNWLSCQNYSIYNLEEIIYKEIFNQIHNTNY